MEKIELKNISFSYGDIQVFKDLSISIKKGQNISIVGGVASGKTTLTKILNNEIKFNGEYLINDKKISKGLKNSINTVNKTKKYDNKKVIDLLFDRLKDNSKEIKEIIKYFKINDYLNNKICELSNEYKYYVLMIINILETDKYLILDDVLCYLNKSQVKYIYSYAKRNKVTIINIASSLDNVLNSKYLVCLYNCKIAMEGEVLSCLKEEKLLKRLGFKLPFMYDLSLQLNYYEVLNDIYLNAKDLESAIWK